jgi:hypothetical protein
MGGGALLAIVRAIESTVDAWKDPVKYAVDFVGAAVVRVELQQGHGPRGLRAAVQVPDPSGREGFLERDADGVVEGDADVDGVGDVFAVVGGCAGLGVGRLGLGQGGGRALAVV